MMGKVRLWLSAYEHLCPMGAYVLWTREMDTDFAPRAGDDIHLSVSEEGEDDISWRVRCHSWSHSGAYELELAHLVVDPAENTTTHGGDYAWAWWTDRDGRPEPMLRRGGWQTWEEWTEAKTKAADQLPT